MSEEVRRDAVRAATARCTVKVTLVPPPKKGTSDIVAAVIAGVVSVFGSAFVLMLCLARLHEDIPKVPALGYVTCFAVIVGLSTVGLTVRPPGKSWWER